MNKSKEKKKKTRNQELKARRAKEAAFWRSVREEDDLPAIQLEIEFKYDHSDRIKQKNYIAPT